MFGGFIMGWLCDVPWLSRPKRALVAWSVLFVYSNAIMGGGLAFENLREKNPPAFIAMHSGQYAGGAMLYFFYGMLDSLWQGVSTYRLTFRADLDSTSTGYLAPCARLRSWLGNSSPSSK